MSESQALEIRKVEDALVLGVNQAGIVHEQREDLVVLIFVGDCAVGVERPQRARADRGGGGGERQLDDGASRKTVAFGAAFAVVPVVVMGVYLVIARRLGAFDAL